MAALLGGDESRGDVDLTTVDDGASIEQLAEVDWVRILAEVVSVRMLTTFAGKMKLLTIGST